MRVYTESQTIGVVKHISEDFMVQLNHGVKIEKEHEATYNLIRQYFEKGEMIPKDLFFFNIARDHIKENPEYYTVLRKAGL